jgi:hypothetical protein
MGWIRFRARDAEGRETQVEIPHPSALAGVDYKARSIQMLALALGGGARELLDRIWQRTTREGGRLVAPAQASGPSFHYLPLGLGDIRGFSVRLHLFALGTDDALVPTLSELLPWAAGAIVVGAPGDVTGGVLRAAAAAFAAKSLPVVLLGHGAALWTAAGGAPPLASYVWTESGQWKALKELTRTMLSALRKG